MSLMNFVAGNVRRWLMDAARIVVVVVDVLGSFQ
jgi:hypothetical protein